MNTRRLASLSLMAATAGGLVHNARALPTQAKTTQNSTAFPISSTDLLQTAGGTLSGTGNFTQEGMAGLPAVADGLYGAQGGAGANGGAAFTAGTGESITVTFPQANGITINSLDTIAAWDSARGSQSYQFEYQSTLMPGVWHRITQVTHDPGQLAGQNVNTLVSVTDSTGILATNVSQVRLNFGNTNFWGWNGYREVDLNGSLSAAPLGPQFLKSIQLNELYTVSGTDLLQAGGITTTTSGDLNQEGVMGAAALTDGGFGPAGGANSNPPGMAAASGDSLGMITYGFDLGASPFGYSLSGVDVYAGWDGFRGGQKYTLSYSLVSDPSTFIPLGGVDMDADSGNTPGGPINTRSMVRDADGELASNVAALRIQFASGTVGFLGYREIDVFGTASIPEPTAPLVLALAGALVTLRRKRR
jgi:hypothetical protein